MSEPLISVIIPVYNSQSYIQEAIHSILEQTIGDFELLVIDDASTDLTANVVQKINDKRIKLLTNKINLGVSASRNKGIKIAKGKFIAFMDSDDISLSKRFEKQLKVFKEKPEVIICGSWLKFLNSNKIIKHKEHHNEIISSLLINCSLSIGVVMYKREALKNVFLNTEFRHGEDYEFWTRIAWQGEIYNIQEPLLLYRYHPQQLSGLKKTEQIKMDFEIRLALFQKINYSKEEFSDELIKKFFLWNEIISLDDLASFFRWIESIKGLNQTKKIFPQKEFENVVNEIRKNVILRIYFTPNIGINKIWRIKALSILGKKESFELVKNKVLKSLNFKN